MSEIRSVINTPSSQYISKAGTMIVLPAQEGQIGVLYNHMPLIVEIKKGKILIYQNQEVIEEIDVNSGIAYIKSDTVEIFT